MEPELFLTKHCKCCGNEFKVGIEKQWASLCLPCWVERKIEEKHKARAGKIQVSKSVFVRRLHDYPLYNHPNIPPWDESLGEFSYS